MTDTETAVAELVQTAFEYFGGGDTSEPVTLRRKRKNMNKTDFQSKCDWLASLDLSQAIIAVDFDGTCVTHDFPAVGTDLPGAEQVLKALISAGAKLILWTMRSDIEFDGTGGPNDVEAQEYLSHCTRSITTRNNSLGRAARNATHTFTSTTPL